MALSLKAVAQRIRDASASDLAFGLSTKIDKSGDTISGSLKFSRNFQLVEGDNHLDIRGATWGQDAAGLALRTINDDDPGTFRLITGKVNNVNKELKGYPNGNLLEFIA